MIEAYMYCVGSEGFPAEIPVLLSFFPLATGIIF
jgi:hypothetical protein